MFSHDSTFDMDADSENFNLCVSRRFWITSMKQDHAKVELRARIGSSADLISCQINEEQTQINDILSSPNKLGHIYQFSKLVLQRSTKSLIICTTPGKRGLTTAALLLGGYLAICENMPPEDHG